MNRVVTRYPLPVRFGATLVCVIFAAAIMRGAVSSGTIIVAFGALCLSVAVLAYRAEVDETEVRIRYFLFFTRRTLIRDITSLVEGRTLFLVAPTAKIPLWGLSLETRERLFQILPRRLQVMAPERSRRSDSAAAAIRKHQRGALFSGIAFLLTAALVIPFFKGNVWHEYWNSLGQYLLLLCLVFFIASVFEAGFTWVLWSSKREIDGIEHPTRR